MIADGDAELDRLHCARLADDLVLERQLCSGCKGKFRRIAGAPEFGCRYFQVLDVHRTLLALTQRKVKIYHHADRINTEN
jgi:hypothetical protein